MDDPRLMCGIAGVLGDIEGTASVDSMVDFLHHRGPDDRGVQTIPVGGSRVILGSTRLAIIDLSSAGHMPMSDPETGHYIVYNGEVYNFLELRRELETCGERFRSETDTEVILKAYRRWGPDCVRRFRGMFAFAIWDGRAHELFLARDRVGKKPLYYHQRPGSAFLFASEVRALLASGLVERQLAAAGLDTYLFNGFVVSPMTMVRGVYSLLPGHWMRVRQDGRVVETVGYWQPPMTTARPNRPSGVVADVRARLEEAVSLRLISDVPLGAFLSGGLDSSTVVALMARSAEDVRTFSVSFDEVAYDESAFARGVAEAFETQHTEVRLRRGDFKAWLSAGLAGMDQPSFDGINTYCVARAARESGLTVALSGLGGDEVFGGYSLFKTVPSLARLATITNYLPGGFARAIEPWLASGPYRAAGPIKALELLRHDEDRRSPILNILAAYQTSSMLFPAWTRDKLLRGNGRGPLDGIWFGLPTEFVRFVRAENGDADPTSILSKIALRLFLGERCLRDTDAMSMAVSLEVRAPFTDHHFVESLWQVPSRIRCQGPPDKPFEWQLFKPYLGASYPFRKKQGFIFPFEDWLREEDLLGIMRATLSNELLAEKLGFDGPAVRGLVEAFERGDPPIPWSRIWALFVLFGWCDRHGLCI